MRRTLLLVLAAAAATTLTGCAALKQPAPSAAAVVPPGWRPNLDAAGVIEPDAGRTVELYWWHGFGDPVLTTIVETALANNADIAMAAARVEAARAQFRLANALRLPNLVGVLAGGRQRDVSAFGLAEDQTVGQADVSISYDLYLFGRLTNESGAARASLLASEAAHDNVRLAVAAAAAGGYATLRALDARLLTLHATLEARADSLKLAQRRAQTGYGSTLDLRQAEAEYYATEQLISAAELAIRRQENGLSLLLSDNPRAIERGSALSTLTPPSVPAGLPSHLLRRRPDIIQAEQQLVAADRSLDAARAAFLPSVQLTGSGGYVASTLLVQPIGIFSLGGSVLALLFDSGRLRAQESGSTARRNQAAYAYRKAALTAFREVEDALAAVRLTTQQEHVIAAQRGAWTGR